MEHRLHRHSCGALIMTPNTLQDLPDDPSDLSMTDDVGSGMSAQSRLISKSVSLAIISSSLILQGCGQAQPGQAGTPVVSPDCQQVNPNDPNKVACPVPQGIAGNGASATPRTTSHSNNSWWWWSGRGGRPLNRSSSTWNNGVSHSGSSGISHSNSSPAAHGSASSSAHTSGSTGHSSSRGGFGSSGHSHSVGG